MAAADPISLSTTLAKVPGMTHAAVRDLKTLGLTNLGRLVAYLPMRHEVLAAEAKIKDLVVGQVVTARGMISATRVVRTGRKPRFEAVLVDDTGRLDLVWFNMAYLHDAIRPGTRLLVRGKLNRFGPGIQIANANHEILPPTQSPGDAPKEDGDEDAGGAGLERIRPVYPANEAMKSGRIERAIGRALPHALPLIDDHLPEDFRKERNLPALAEAYRMQHAPSNMDEVAASRRRLAYDELLLLQLGVAMKRAHLRLGMKSPKLRWNAAIDGHIRERFPFALTPSQDGVVMEIVGDLTSDVPSNRLIQGDVGSGKTLVALYAMLLAVASKHQAALLAPTEILAEQHFEGIARILGGSRVRARLLVGGLKKGEREEIVGGLRSGEIDLVVGTHAVLTEGVSFKSLGVAIIDEQHRFGVSQRAVWRERAGASGVVPHVVVMTATPIPRTLAISLFGDLDISTIRELPPGRSPITTRLCPAGPTGGTLPIDDGLTRERVYAEVAERLGRGEQAYIVAPAIDPTDAEDDPPLPGQAPSRRRPQPELRNVRALAEEMRTLLPGKRIGTMHGRLPRETREATMDRFRRGEIDALVATSVIEVGVDVPNATAIVVEDADRFGLAQLHQLRGRVGRGRIASVCYLIADPKTDDAVQRLHALRTMSSGFLLAERDFEIRGPGELFGTRQSGLPPFKVADLSRDLDLLALARRDAAGWIGQSPALAKPHEAVIRRRLFKSLGDALGLADVG